MVPTNSHELTVCFSHSSMLNIHHFLQLSLRLVVIFCTRLADAFDGKNATGYVNYAVFGHIGDHCHTFGQFWDRGPVGYFSQIWSW